MPEKKKYAMGYACNYLHKPQLPGLQSRPASYAGTSFNSDWAFLSNYILKSIQIESQNSSEEAKLISTAITFHEECQLVPVEKLKKFFEALPAFVHTIIFNSEHIKNYSINELIQLGKSLKYIKNIKQTEGTVISPKLKHLIANMGSEIDKTLITKALEKYLPPVLATGAVASFLFTAQDNDRAATKKKAEDAIQQEEQDSLAHNKDNAGASARDAIKQEKRDSWARNAFKLDCLCAFALISTTVLLVGIIAITAASGIPLIIAGSSGLFMAASYAIYNRKEIAQTISEDKPPLKP